MGEKKTGEWGETQTVLPLLFSLKFFIFLLSRSLFYIFFLFRIYNFLNPLKFVQTNLEVLKHVIMCSIYFVNLCPAIRIITWTHIYLHGKIISFYELIVYQKKAL